MSVHSFTLFMLIPMNCTCTDSHGLLILTTLGCLMIMSEEEGRELAIEMDRLFAVAHKRVWPREWA